jgi:hypothetical protein
MSLCIVNAKELETAAPHIAAHQTLTLLVSDIITEWKEIINGTRTLKVANLDVLLLSPFSGSFLDLRILLFFGVMAEVCSCAAACTITLATNETQAQKAFDLGCATFADKAPDYTLKQLNTRKFVVVPAVQ